MVFLIDISCLLDFFLFSYLRGSNVVSLIVWYFRCSCVQYCLEWIHYSQLTKSDTKVLPSPFVTVRALFCPDSNCLILHLFQSLLDGRLFRRRKRRVNCSRRRSSWMTSVLSTRYSRQMTERWTKVFEKSLPSCRTLWRTLCTSISANGQSEHCHRVSCGLVWLVAFRYCSGRNGKIQSPWAAFLLIVQCRLVCDDWTVYCCTHVRRPSLLYARSGLRSANSTITTGMYVRGFASSSVKYVSRMLDRQHGTVTDAFLNI